MPRQSDLPGVEGPGVAQTRIPSIDKAAEDYIAERDKRCRQTPKEIAAKQKLVDLLHKNAEKIGKDDEGILRYRYEDVVVILKPGKETLKVKEVSSGDEGEEE